MEEQIINSSNYISQSGKSFDILKLILAIFVVGIHTMPVTINIRPLFRIAVPLFFLMSSFFFFHKQSRLENNEDKRRAFLSYLRRIVILYLFWTILLLPYIIYSKGWYHFDLQVGLKIVKSFLFSGTFPASWYLTASIISISVVWLLSKYINNTILLCIGILSYIVCCITSNYLSLCEDFPSAIGLYKSFSFVFGKPCNSFVGALLFICIGKVFAEKRVYLNNKLLLALFLLFLVFLFVEAEIIRSNRFNLTKIDYSDDCFFSLPLLCMFLFMLLGQNPITLHVNTRVLRNCSTIIYCIHLTISNLLRISLGLLSGCLLFIAVAIISLCISFLILRIERFSRFQWLSYAH